VISFIELSPPEGFDDRIGKPLRIQREIENLARRLFEAYGYEEYVPPTLERITTFTDALSEDLLTTAWTDREAKPEEPSERAKRDFFLIRVINFEGDKPVNSYICVFRPEGTASLCRFIAGQIVKGVDLSKFLPLKVYYIITCFRNEDISKLDPTRRREFNQIGIEYVGNPDLNADVEVFFLGYNLLSQLFPGKVSLRISDVNIFRKLCKKSGYGLRERVEMKEYLDELSKLRVMGKSIDNLQGKIEQKIKSLPSNLREAWRDVYSLRGEEDEIKIVEEDTETDLGKLREFLQKLKEYRVKAIFDPAMIRGWEYYTSIIAQYDVRGSNKIYPEVGGGGRYDTLIGNFLRRYGIEEEIPATGFALGTERLVEIRLKGETL